MELTENMIEFISGQRTATITFSNLKHINRIKKLYEDRPGEFKYFHQNEDGSIIAKVPLRWVKVSPPRENNRVYTEEERAAIAERLKNSRKSQ